MSALLELFRRLLAELRRLIVIAPVQAGYAYGSGGIVYIQQVIASLY